jgi:hypothetical protein
MACKSFLDEPTHSRGLGKACIAGIKLYLYGNKKMQGKTYLFFR